MPPSKRAIQTALKIGWERTEELHTILEKRYRELNGHDHSKALH